MKFSIYEIIFSVLFVGCAENSFSQVEQAAGRVSPKELTIPASPVFDMMGVTPSLVNRTSDIKDFKVDWSFKSWRLNPNLAIQSQPIWELFYNRQDVDKYQKASSFLRRLSSLDVSIGSVQNEESDRRMGFAVKLNLFTQKDPLLAQELYTDVSDKFKAEKAELENQWKELKFRLDTTQNILEKPALREQIKSTEQQLSSINSRRRLEVNERAKIFVEENWNAASIDIAYGRVYTYKTDSAGGLEGLRLNRNTGRSAWINGNLGIGKKFLLTGLFRTSWYEEEVDFIMKDLSTGEESSRKAVADNTLYTMGLNLRYGGSIYTFFIEFFYENKGLKTPVEALNEAFGGPHSGFEIVASSVKWDVVHPNTISFGGDWRIGRSVMLNYGMRCIFNNDWKFKTFTPVVSIACLMR